jgi:hypothetical protein
MRLQLATLIMVSFYALLIGGHEEGVCARLTFIKHLCCPPCYWSTPISY